MRAATLLLLAGLASSAGVADLTFGGGQVLQNVGWSSYTFVGVAPHVGGASVYLLNRGTLYAVELPSYSARVVLRNVDKVSVSASSALRRLAWTSDGVVSIAPVLDDGNIDLDHVRVLGAGDTAFIACNDVRCIVAADIPPLGSFLASDPGGFLFFDYSKRVLTRLRNDGSMTQTPIPAERGAVTAADFDGADYTLVFEPDKVVAVAHLSLGGELSDARLIVDDREYSTYQSAGSRIVWNGASHLLVTHETTFDYPQPYYLWPTTATGHWLGRDLAPFGKTFELSEYIATRPGGAVYDSGTIWVAWQWHNQNPSFDPTSFLVISAVDASTSAFKNYGVRTFGSTARVLAAAAGPSHLLGVWSEEEPLTHRFTIRAKLDPKGTALTIGESAQRQAATARVGDDYLAVARMDDALAAMHIDPNGAAPVDFGFLAHGSAPVAVAANDRQFLAGVNDDGQLVAAGLRPDGEPLATKVDLGAADAGAPVGAASDGAFFALLTRRGGALVVTVVDGIGDVLGTNSLGAGPGSFAIAWSGADYVVVAGDGTMLRTWRLSRYADVLAAAAVPSTRIPRSIGRCAGSVIATWESTPGEISELLGGGLAWNKVYNGSLGVVTERDAYRAVRVWEENNPFDHAQPIPTQEVKASVPRRWHAVR